MYIVFEGIVGCGKTTQSKKLVDYLRYMYPTKQAVWTKEPGGTEIADAIRKIAQGTHFVEEMDPICEAYLYAASRAQSLRAIVHPALKEGSFVVADRSFVSSLTNQAAGRKIGIEKVLKINESAIDDIMPDLIIYLSFPVAEALKRLDDHANDKFESFGEDFYTAVANGYEEVSTMELFKHKWLTIDAVGTEEEIFERIKNGIRPYLEKIT